jgi:hypothetical protein
MKTEKTTPEGVKEVTLPSGKVATIFPGKGRHSVAAQKMCGSDTSKFINCLMYQLVEIDGQRQTIEDFEELSLRDYNKLVEAFSGENF